MLNIINLEHTNDFLNHLVKEVSNQDSTFKFTSVKQLFDYLTKDNSLANLIVPTVYNYFKNKYFDSYGFTEDFKRFLLKSDFFYTAASVKYHSNHIFGLLYHSLLVFDLSLNKFKSLLDNSKFYDFKTMDLELNISLERDLFFSSMFHDLCKVGTYKFIKEKGSITIQYNTETNSLGHGSYSAYLLSYYQRVNPLVFSIVNYHMGSWNLANTQDSIEASNFNRVRNLNCLVDIVHLSDTEAGLYEFTYTKPK